MGLRTLLEFSGGADSQLALLPFFFSRQRKVDHHCGDHIFGHIVMWSCRLYLDIPQEIIWLPVQYSKYCTGSAFEDEPSHGTMLHTTVSKCTTYNKKFILSTSTGSGLFKIVNVFRRPITLSTCMRIIESCFDFSTSHCVSCVLPLLNAGSSSLAPCTAKSSVNVKPRSASTTSPQSSILKNLVPKESSFLLNTQQEIF